MLTRNFLLILVASLLAISVVGCGDDEKKDTDTDTTDTTDVTDTQPDVSPDGELMDTRDMTDTTDVTDVTDATDTDMGFELPPWTPDGDCTQIITWGQEDETAIRTIFLDAVANDIICFSPGPFEFTRELSLTVDDVEVRGDGMGVTNLDFANQDSGSNGLFVRSDGFTIRDITVKNTPGDAIRVEGTVARFAQNIHFDGVEVTWDAGPQTENGAYGFYPVLTENVLMESCVASYASDAGIYVGQSRNVVVRDNEAYGNVAGIEIENTIGAEVYNNHAHDNTGGLLIFDLPDKPVQGGRSTLAYDNIIENNNQANFAAAGNIVASVPVGTGILVLSSDENEIRNNTITGNNTAGILIVSYFLLDPGYKPDCDDGDDNDNDMATDLDDTDCTDAFDDSEEPGKAEYDPYPEQNHIHANTLYGNGTMPATLPIIQVVLTLIGITEFEQMAWDGVIDSRKTTEIRNCFNTTNVDDMMMPATWRNLDADNNFMASTTDLSAGMHDCVGITVPPVVLP